MEEPCVQILNKTTYGFSSILIRNYNRFAAIENIENFYRNSIILIDSLISYKPLNINTNSCNI